MSEISIFNIAININVNLCHHEHFVPAPHRRSRRDAASALFLSPAAPRQWGLNCGPAPSLGRWLSPCQQIMTINPVALDVVMSLCRNLLLKQFNLACSSLTAGRSLFNGATFNTARTNKSNTGNNRSDKNTQNKDTIAFILSWVCGTTYQMTFCWCKDGACRTTRNLKLVLNLTGSRC